ncbi:hypothetical protein ACF3DV_18330 [Chlorogloeopsis fritschii PCC 9212]|nr:hypothetical protein [Chlorogloeopsis fritschii]
MKIRCVCPVGGLRSLQKATSSEPPTLRERLACGKGYAQRRTEELH